jgi:hypothetical protein
MAVGTGRFKRGIKTYFIGEGEDSLSRLLSVFRGLPCGSDGLRGGRNWTDAVDDFLDKTPGRSLSWYEGRRESIQRRVSGGCLVRPSGCPFALDLYWG